MKINNYPDNEEFFSLWLYVDKRVLIPRNDTEILVEKAIKEIKNSEYTLIDVGTGSCAILIAMMKNLSFEIIWSYALDISKDALEVAKINVQKHNLENKVILSESDLLEIFLNKTFILDTKNVIITANLPYIKDWDIENMDKEVLENEPHIALFGWEKTGFEMYERLIDQIYELKKMSNLDIILFIEIWFDQYDYSKNYLNNLWLDFEYFKDLGWIWRCVKIIF